MVVIYVEETQRQAHTHWLPLCIQNLWFMFQSAETLHGRWDEMFVYPFVSLVNLLELMYEA